MTEDVIVVNGQNPHCHAISSDFSMAIVAAVTFRGFVTPGDPTDSSSHVSLCSDMRRCLISRIRCDAGDVAVTTDTMKSTDNNITNG